MSEVMPGLGRRPLSEWDGLRVVRQGHANGCALAALAMVTGQTYDEVVADFTARWPGEPLNLDERGLYHGDTEWYLAINGYVWRYLYAGWKHDPWPPEPFAPIHIAAVKQPSGNQHYVIVTDDGTVLDPLDDQPKSLAAWEKVNNVMGIWPEQSVIALVRASDDDRTIG